MKLAIISGILGILAFLPFQYLFIFGFFYLVPFFVFLVKEEKLRRLIAGSLIFKIIFCLGAVYYTLEPITWVCSVIIFLGLPLSVFALKKVRFFRENYIAVLAFIPVLWTFWDLTEASFSPMPAYIITLGNVFGHSPFLGLAGFHGFVGLTFFGAAVNTLFALYFFIPRKKYLQNSAIIIIIIIFALAFSQWRLHKNRLDYNSGKNTLNIASISVNEKFSPPDFEKLRKELQSNNADLIILPEDILNAAGTDYTNKNFFVMRDLAKNTRINLLANFDIFENPDLENRKIFNSTFLFDKDGTVSDMRNKKRLTFIGEYWPFGNWRPFFFDWTLTTNPEYKNYAVFSHINYSQGKEKNLTLKTNDKTINFSSLICLEIHYPQDVKKRKKDGASFIVNSSSNRWIDIGTKHFLYLSEGLKKIESVWLNIPVISSGVNDYAGIITPDGENYSYDFNSENNFTIFYGKINY
ncbi:MAG: nitrilase-related carbon-nitrogen hydrolase [Patescibacteria group bacterium]|nr:nitrilase-related carbon-nitrogen hydrolase [Patescibacteria group bacterium]